MHIWQAYCKKKIIKINEKNERDEKKARDPQCSFIYFRQKFRPAEEETMI